jgi:hypothetical protein
MIYYSNLLFSICGEIKELWEGLLMNKFKKILLTDHVSCIKEGQTSAFEGSR